MRLFQRLIIYLTAALMPVMILQAQPKLEFNLRKPKQFEERKLPSEKMAEKKFTFMRHFFQNNFTHYNYFFNANLRLNEIIDESKAQTKDDYTRLLPFYPYSLDQTSKSGFLDSILQKCTAGILLHDLRNDWIDNMYLVMGKAYLLRKNFDSAAMTFQYINYSFSPKEKGGYDKYIGSNAEEGGNAFSVATKEKTNKFSYLVTRPPSRNESFVWQVRTLTENGDYIDASSLIEILKADPYFPTRLKEELSEARAYLYYRIQMWDSSATYLVKAIPNAANPTEKARWWFLAGQMYQQAGQFEKASDAYAKCTSMTLDPVMEVYARLNSIRLHKGDDPKIIDQNIASLLSMAKKDKYQSYRDIIYYAAALFEMERKGYEPAKTYLAKSIKYNDAFADQRSRSFMLLGDIAFDQKKYADASPNYDSVNAVILNLDDSLKLEKRKPGVKDIYLAEQIIIRQDSLLKLAAMPEQERIAKVKQVSRQLRKLRGLKDEPNSAGSGGAFGSTNTNLAAQPTNTPLPSLFTDPSGNWYFYDVSIRANGFTKFKEKWGSRPNVDNWRRSSSIVVMTPASGGNPDEPLQPVVTGDNADDNFDTTDISFDNLYARIPLSAERQQRAENRIINALYSEGVALHEKLEDYPEAIKVFEEILQRRDTGFVVEKSLFALVHCYTQIGDAANASRCKQLLQKGFPNGGITEQLKGRNTALEEMKNEKANAQYKKIYDLFIEGNFDQALAEKRIADSALGKNYWTPQLLYIESVYHIRQREDSLAILSLNIIVSQFGAEPLAARAKKMIEVLGRRKEIEDYLTKLEVTRAKEDETVVSLPEPRKSTTTVQPKDSAANKIIQPPVTVPAIDSSSKKLVTAVPTQVSPYIIDPAEPCTVAIVLEKIDPAYVNEVLYSFNSSSRKNFNGQPVTASKKKLKDGLWLLLLQSPEFKNAAAGVDYISYIKPIAEKEIISWLDASKYSYSIISATNMTLLEQDPNIGLYQKVLKETFPGKF